MTEKRMYSADKLLQRCRELSQIAKERKALLNRLTGTSERDERVREKVAASHYRALEKGIVFLAEFLSREIPPPTASPSKERKKSRQEDVYVFLADYASEHPGEPITLSKIGEQFGFSRQRASQIYHLLEADKKDLPPLSAALNRKRKNANLGRVTETTTSLPTEDKAQKLKSSGDIFDAEAEKKKVLEGQILHLRQDLRMGSNAIAKELAVSRALVTSVLRKLEKSGEDVRLRAKRRTAQELDEFDEKVRTLHKKGLENKEIAALLDEKDTFGVSNSLVRQRKKGLLAVPQLIRRREAIKQLRLQGWGNKRISEELGIPETSVHQIAHQLIKKGEISRLKKTGRKRDEAFYSEVERLKREGRKDADIAVLLEKSPSQVHNVVKKLYKLGRLTKD